MKSMTGYGRATKIFDDLELTVELKSVNNRYLDLSVRLPRSYSVLEDRVRKTVSAAVSRGKVDVYCSAQSLSTSNAEITLDEPLTRQYLEALCQLRDTFGLRDDVTVSTVARNSELFLRRIPEEDTERIWAALSEVLQEALDRYNAMRTTEGETLKADFREKLSEIRSHVSQIEEKAPETVTLYRERLEAKLNELVGGIADPSRILTEVAILSDKVAIDEELTRLKSHIAQFDSILDEAIPIGRKLDFLTQELNREVNTIGSKCSRLEITKTVLELKNCLEKVREQIQNVE